MTRFLCLMAALLWAGLAIAQDDDRGLIIGFLEDQLSDAGRDIRIEGFRGSLTGRAEMDQLTIADDTGIWLTLRGAVLDWNQGAILSGRVEVEQLTAEELILARIPSTASSSTPDAEATPFRLPELPVSVAIAQMGIDRVDLSSSVVGEPVVLQVDGALSLASGAGAAKLSLHRTDVIEGSFTLDGAFDNQTDILRLMVALEEPENGITSRLVGIPGRPSVSASIAGEGPLDDFTADLALATDGEDRLTGQVTLGPSTFNAQLGGDVTALVLPDYQEFFGPEVSLVAQGARDPDGTVTLEDLTLEAAHVALTGQAAFASSGLPLSFDISGQIKDPGGEPVLLPISDQRAFL
ncbi:MAG: hypothetical protein AAFV38_14630, partial [Pseudomonadota bacterium]